MRFVLETFCNAFRFDYGEKFWVIKHKYFTCHCSSDKCRYNKSSIYGFLKEYYIRIGEPLPDDAKPPAVAAAAAAAANKQKEEAIAAAASASKAEVPAAAESQPETKKATEIVDTPTTIVKQEKMDVDEVSDESKMNESVEEKREEEKAADDETSSESGKGKRRPRRAAAAAASKKPEESK